MDDRAVSDPTEHGRRVGEALLGTCGSITATLEQMDLDPGLEDDLAFCYAVDSVAMCCSCCGWYVEPCELDDHDRCDDCRPDDED